MCTDLPGTNVCTRALGPIYLSRRGKDAGGRSKSETVYGADVDGWQNPTSRKDEREESRVLNWEAAAWDGSA